MNYTNNIDRYYMHAHYNQVREKESNRNKMLWLLLLIGILLAGLFFIYKSYQHGEITNFFENAKVESTKLENDFTTNVKESTVMASVNEASKKVEPTVSSEKSIKDNDIEKIDVVASQKLTESKRDTVFTTNIKSDSKDKTESAKSLTKLASGAVTPTLLEKVKSSTAPLLSNVTSKEEKSLVLAVTAKETNSTVPTTTVTSEKAKSTAIVTAAIPDTNLSKALPMETFHLYVISRGETLYSIAMSQYHDRGMYQKIIEANPNLENPNSIHEGEEILLPIVDEQKAYSDILHFK